MKNAAILFLMPLTLVFLQNCGEEFNSVESVDKSTSSSSALLKAPSSSTSAQTFSGSNTLPSSLQVSPDGHRLVTDTGIPFFWLADTGWTLMLMNPTEVDLYMQNRAAKIFNVIQMMAIRTYNFDPTRMNLNLKNYNGDSAFTSLGPVIFNETYWQHIDYIVDTAEKYGIYIAMFALWGLDVDTLFSNPSVHNYQYGNMLAKRYKNKKNIIWVVSGEYEKVADWKSGARPTSKEFALIRNIAQGISAGKAPEQLMSIHPIGTSSYNFHNDRWLSFNMQQTYTRLNFNVSRITSDYNKSPTKPVINAEPGYEGRVSGSARTPWHMRLQAYWSVFSGAFGFTYGAYKVFGTLPGWQQALNIEGAYDMQHLKDLIQSRPFLGSSPDHSVVNTPGSYTNYKNPNSLTYRAALRGKNTNFIFVYSTHGLSINMNLSKFSGRQVNAWWFNPRDGQIYDNKQKRSKSPFSQFKASGSKTFTPPATSTGPDNDWVLVLDDASQGYGVPGQGGKSSAPTPAPQAPASVLSTYSLMDRMIYDVNHIFKLSPYAGHSPPCSILKKLVL